MSVYSAIEYIDLLLYWPLYTPLQHGAPQHVRDELCASISHRRRCLGARGASPSRARRRRQCTRTARARRRRLRWFQTSLGGRGIGRRGHTCCLFAVYFSVCIKLLYKDEHRCIKCYTRTRVASRPSIAIYSYTALYIILTVDSLQRYTLYNLYNTPRTARAGPDERGLETDWRVTRHAAVTCDDRHTRGSLVSWCACVTNLLISATRTPPIGFLLIKKKAK